MESSTSGTGIGTKINIIRRHRRETSLIDISADICGWNAPTSRGHLSLAQRTDSRLLSSLEPSEQTISHIIQRFASAAMFAHIKQLPLTNDGAWSLCAPDNFVAYHQPFDPAREGVTVDQGSYWKMTSMCYPIETLLSVTPPHVSSTDAAIADSRMLRDLSQLCSRSSVDVERSFRAIEWVGFAFANPVGHLYESRIVAMSTAFEILLELSRQGKAQDFSDKVNARLLPNNMPKITKAAPHRTKPVADNAIGVVSGFLRCEEQDSTRG